MLPELDRTEHLLHSLRTNFILEISGDGLADKFPRNLSATRTDFALEIAHARLARVVTNDFQNAFVSKFELFSAQAVCFGLLRNQVALRDFEFLAFRVT